MLSMERADYKFEARNPNFETNPNISSFRTFLFFGFRICFGFRYTYFGFSSSSDLFDFG